MGLIRLPPINRYSSMDCKRVTLVLQYRERGLEWLATRKISLRLKNSSTAITFMVRSRCVSCCGILPISRSIIPEHPRKSTRLRPRSSAARRTSILILIQWFASRLGACARNLPSTMHPREQRTKSWWRCLGETMLSLFMTALKEMAGTTWGRARDCKGGGGQDPNPSCVVHCTCCLVRRSRCHRGRCYRPANNPQNCGSPPSRR